MEKLLLKANDIKIKQNQISQKIKKEKFEDLHSHLRVKELIYSYLELEVKLNVYLDIISENKK